MGAGRERRGWCCNYCLCGASFAFLYIPTHCSFPGTWHWDRPGRVWLEHRLRTELGGVHFAQILERNNCNKTFLKFKELHARLHRDFLLLVSPFAARTAQRFNLDVRVGREGVLRLLRSLAKHSGHYIDPHALMLVRSPNPNSIRFNPDNADHWKDECRMYEVMTCTVQG